MSPDNEPDENAQGDVGAANSHWQQQVEPDDRQRLHARLLAQVRDALVVARGPLREVIYWNDEAAALYGVSRAEALGCPMDELFEHRWLSDEQQQQALTTLAAGDVWHGLHEVIRRDGRLLITESTVQVTLDAEGRLDTALAVVRDVTQRTAEEQSLRRSERRYQLLADWMDDIVGLAAPDGQTLYLSPSYFRKTHWTWDDLRAVNYRTRVHPDDLALVETTRQANFRGEGTRMQYRCLCKDGTYLWLEVAATPILTADGRVENIVWVSRDITERKAAEQRQRELEAQIHHADKLKSVGLLAGGVAHDFNNLLIAMLNQAAVALGQLGEESPAREPVEQIRRAARQAARLTGQLLAYAGKGKFHVEGLDLSSEVEELTFLLRSAISKQAELQLILADDLPDILADGNQIRHVVMNLITNASDALEGPGTITVRTGVVEATTEQLRCRWIDETPPAGQYVVLEVEDTGRGLDSDTVERAFEPFFTTKQAGRGLGLAAVLGIVRQNHGSIQIHTSAEEGTRFCVYWPAVKARGATRDPSWADAVGESADRSPTDSAFATFDSNVARPLLLLVEDEPLVLQATQSLLEGSGYRTITATSAGESIDRFSQYAATIDAVVADRILPDRSGDQLVVELRRQRPELPAVLWTGYCDNAQDLMVVNDRRTRVLEKTAGPEGLLKALETVLATAEN